MFNRGIFFAGLAWLLAATAPAEVAEQKPIACPGVYEGHLQGVTTDAGGNIYWSFTVALVKTDAGGRLLASVEAPTHQGDLTWREGKVYVAVNLGAFNREPGHADSWVYVYRDDDLALIAKHPVPEAVHGAGGIDHRDGHFFIVGGLPEGHTENYVYEYDGDFNFVKRHVIASGYTRLGIQTAFHADGVWWFGCYGSPQVLLKTDAAFNLLGIDEFEASLGICRGPGETLLIGRAAGPPRHQGQALFATVAENGWLRLANKPREAPAEEEAPPRP